MRRAFGADLELPRVLSFRAGYLDRIWVKNCVAVGLASGFLEPLEATSIWATVLTLRELLRVHLPQNDARAHDELNRFHRVLQQRIVDFLYLHYLSDRRDTPFWRTFRERTTPTPLSAEVLDSGGYRWPFEEDPRIAGNPSPFTAASYLWVAKGIGLLDVPSLARYWDYYGLHEGYAYRVEAHRRHLASVGEACLPHEVVLDGLKRYALQERRSA